jgi:hypothetical protein
LRGKAPDSPASLYAARAGHVDVEQHQIKSMLPDGAHGLLSASRFLYAESARSQRFSKRTSESKFIIDD